MKMTDAQKNDVLAKIRGFWGDREFRCGVCHHNRWNLDDDLHELRNYKLGAAADLAAPLVLLTCTTCGHVHLFSAFKLGVLTPGHRTGTTPQGA